MRQILALILSLCCSSLWAEGRFDYSDIRKNTFAQRTVAGLRPMADGMHYTATQSGNIIKYSYRTGLPVDTLLRATQYKDVMERFSDYELSGEESKILLTTGRKPIYRHSFTADYWVYTIDGSRFNKLTEQGGEQIATFSPDAQKVAFMRDNNLWLVSLDNMSLTEITTDGARNAIINGHTDWVYEEEFGFTRAFEFSPDSRCIAFLRFDESNVREFAMMRYDNKLYPTPYIYKYPKAGEANSQVEVRLYDIASQETIAAADTSEHYIPRLGWTPSSELFTYRTNRLQNRFELLTYDAQMHPKVVYSEQNARYMERPTQQTVTFLPDGDRFVVISERSGYRHFYMHSIKKGAVGAVTTGAWDVTSLVGIVGEQLYYISCEGSPLRRNLYRISLSGKNKQRLTTGEGTYRIEPSNGMRYYISYFSNAATPNTVTLHTADGKLVRTLENNTALKQKIAELKIPVREFFTFTTPRGDTLNGYIMRPNGFDPSRRYPVLMSQYSGPDSQEVTDKWTIGWCDVMVQKGYVVVSVDGRGTGCRGEKFRKCTYGRLGTLEVDDQISAAEYLAAQPWVDSARIGIYGWSYGGFMTLGTLMRSGELFRMGIAVAPVTSWRFYDTIYTEIYNGLPQDNASGYDDKVPLNLADGLQSRLMIIHGSADDNVHIQNTYAMVDALVKADKKFDLMVYPDNNHSMRNSGRHHVMEKMIEYTLANL